MIQIVDNLIQQIQDKRKQNLESKINQYPRTKLIASDIVDCDRYLTYSVLNWQDRPKHDADLQGLFDAGNQEEKNIIRELIDLGFNVIHAQTPFEIKDNKGNIMCSGKIDGKIEIEHGTPAIPFEIKNIHPMIFNGLNSADDFNKKTFYKKYLKQIQLYLFGNNIEAGFFIISNGRGQWKLFPVVLDYGFCEQILQRIERTWKHIQAKTYPDKVDYNEQLCDRCAFNHICLPEKINNGANIINNEELEINLDRHQELKPLVEEFEDLDDTIKSTFKGVSDSIIGTKYRIISSCSKGTRIDTKALPEDIKKQYSIPTEKWTTKIIKLGEKL